MFEGKEKGRGVHVLFLFWLRGGKGEKVSLTEAPDFRDSVKKKEGTTPPFSPTRGKKKKRRGKKGITRKALHFVREKN